MSQYNKTVLTHAGLELAKRANAGQAKFGITRAVTSADDWSHKTVQDLEEVTTIPNIMQQGTIMDTDEVESSNSVIGVSLCFTNKNLSTGYQIRIIGLYVKEEGQENDFLYAVTTAITPEYMSSFADKVLYKFNMQMYLVIGKAQAVNVVINEGTAVTSTQFNKYKGEVADNLKKLENTHKEDMSHVAKSASINGGAEILPNEAGKLELVVPDPDLSKYVSLEQLTEMLQGKADITAIPDKTDTEEGIRQAKAAAKTADDKAQSALDSKADKTDVYTKKAVDDAFNTRDSNITNAVNLANQAQETANTKANSSDVYTKTESDGRFARSATVNGGETITPNSEGNLALTVPDPDLSNLATKEENAQKADKTSVYTKTETYNRTEIDDKAKGTIVNNYDIDTKTPTTEVKQYNQKWLVDNAVLAGFADHINRLRGRNQLSNPNFNETKETGVYYVTNPTTENHAPCDNYGTLIVANGNNSRCAQMFISDTQPVRFFYRNQLDSGVWLDWQESARQSDLNHAVNQINYIKANYIEGRRFAKSQEAQAEAWENENPQRIAFITK